METKHWRLLVVLETRSVETVWRLESGDPSASLAGALLETGRSDF